MKTTALGAIATLALLAACSSTPAPTTTTNTGAAEVATGPAPGSEQDLVANVGDRVFFAFDQSTLTPDDQTTLDRQAAWLAKYSNVDVLIAGNCDPRGTETYNLALGHRRADATRDYLVAKNIDPSRLQTASYGKDCLISSGNTDQDYAQDRVSITSVQGSNPQNCRTGN